MRRTLNDTTQVISQSFNASSLNMNFCLEFYYYLSGDAMSLNIYLVSRSLSNLAWQRDLDHGSSYWWKGEVELLATREFRYMFEAQTIKNRSQGLIGIDDVILRRGQCFK